MKKAVKLIKGIGLKTAKAAANSSSFIYAYQPKEPKDLKKRLAGK